MFFLYSLQQGIYSLSNGVTYLAEVSKVGKQGEQGEQACFNDKENLA